MPGGGPITLKRNWIINQSGQHGNRPLVLRGHLTGGTDVCVYLRLHDEEAGPFEFRVTSRKMDLVCLEIAKVRRTHTNLNVLTS